ncbi:ALP1-like protein [Tanacetum coccineum]
MTRTPLLQRKIQTKRAAMIAALGAANAVFVVARRYFKLVLNAVCRLHKEFYKIPVPVPNNEFDERWKWFKGCLGALDGTYVKVRVPESEQKPYRTRKGEICTNVIGVCTRDCQFIYVLAGWEGSAAHSRNYYLCDVGYTNSEGLLTPYHGQRNCIERCFGLIKARWAILRDVSYHPLDSMPRIIIACCLMHNFIRTTMHEDPLDNEVVINHMQHANDHDNVISTIETSQGWSKSRDNLANEMFNEWNARQQHTEQPEVINKGRVDRYTEQCQVKSPKLDSSLDNKTTYNTSCFRRSIGTRCQGCIGLLQFGLARFKDFYIIFGENSKKVGDKIIASAGQYIAHDILDEVITNIQSLSHITPQQRIRGMHIIGRNAIVMSADSAVTYTSVHSEVRSWSIPSEDPYEETARQLFEQAPRSPVYVPENHIPVYIPEPEHPEDLMRAASPSTYHFPSGTPPLLPIPLPAPSTSRRADIPEADTPPRKRLLLTTPRPGYEIGESSAAVAARQPGATIETRLLDTERRMMTALELVNRRVTYQRQAADIFAVQHIMRTPGPGG